MRWQKTCELAQVADARSVARGESTERTERTMMAQLGGYIGPSSAGQRLAPLQCLTLEQYDEVDWNAESRANGWTNAAIINQFRLRNANKGQRTQSEAVLLMRKGVIKKDDVLIDLNEISEIGTHSDLNQCEYVMVPSIKKEKFENNLKQRK